MTVAIAQAIAPPELEGARALFDAYARSLEFSLDFQGFDDELATLPGRYAPPTGRLLVATVDGAPAGCIALRRLDDRTCEMKRLYVRPEHQGRGLGRALVEALITEARGAGYERMRLDTVPSMRSARALYAALGFRAIAPYTTNPVPGAQFLELTL